MSMARPTSLSSYLRGEGSKISVLVCQSGRNRVREEDDESIECDDAYHDESSANECEK